MTSASGQHQLTHLELIVAKLGAQAPVANGDAVLGRVDSKTIAIDLTGEGQCIQSAAALQIRAQAAVDHRVGAGEHFHRLQRGELERSHDSGLRPAIQRATVASGSRASVCSASSSR